MRTGEYITDRLLPEFVAVAAAAKGIECVRMSGDWVLRLERQGTIRWVLGYQFDLNRAAASALAHDKVATHLALLQAGVATVPHILARSVLSQPVAAELLEMEGPIVVKPVSGSGGRDVHIVADGASAASLIESKQTPGWAASPFCDIAAEYRVIMLDGQALLSYEKSQPVELEGLRFFNLGLGAKPQDISDPQLFRSVTEIAHNVCEHLSLRLASVDVVRLVTGELMVMEVNDGLMMENYARHSPEYKNRAATIYDAVVAAMFA